MFLPAVAHTLQAQAPPLSRLWWTAFGLLFLRAVAAKVLHCPLLWWLLRVVFVPLQRPRPQGRPPSLPAAFAPFVAALLGVHLATLTPLLCGADTLHDRAQPELCCQLSAAVAVLKQRLQKFATGSRLLPGDAASVLPDSFCGSSVINTGEHGVSVCVRVCDYSIGGLVSVFVLMGGAWSGVACPCGCKAR
jgi:hypothetical protein